MRIKVNSCEGSERKEESWRGNLSLLREYLSNPEQNVGEIWTIKAILMRTHMEMRNTLLENGEKAILTIKWQRTWLDYVHFLMFVKGRTSKQ